MLNNVRYVAGVKINIGLNTASLIEGISELLKDFNGHKGSYVSTTNSEFIISAQKDNKFREVINNAYYSIPDGSGVLLAVDYLEKVKHYKKFPFFSVVALFFGLYIGIKSIFSRDISKKRLSGVDLIYEICDFAQKNNKTVFFLGGRARSKWGNFVSNSLDVAQLTASNLKEKYPSLQIVGYTSKFSYKEKDDFNTISYINDCISEKNISKIDFLFVAYGHNKQENWIVRNMANMNVRLAVGVGGSFDYISGYMKRAPKIFIDMNLEWLYRLLSEPWRLRRVLKAFPIFPLYIYYLSLKS